MKKIWGILMIGALLLMSTPAAAHMFWLNPADCFPEVGGAVEIGIGWGHKYPLDRVDQEVKEGRVEALEALDPQGRTVALERLAVDRYRLKVEQPGAYIVTARMPSGFFTMTPDGRKWGDKKSVAEAVKCTNFHMLAKTVIIAGGAAAQRATPGGQPLELLPVGDPASVKPGGHFTAEIRYDGRPLAATPVKAVYAGFTPASAADAGAAQAEKRPSHGAAYPVELTSDSQGRVTIPLERAGHWLVVLSHKAAFPDAATCDEYMFTTTYAFEVR